MKKPNIVHRIMSKLSTSPYLPLSWRIRIGLLGMKLLLLPGQLKDKCLGKKRVLVTKVMWDWHFYQLADSSHIQMRDVEYRLKRDKLPWYSTKVMRGTQCHRVDNIPLPLQSHNRIVETLNNLNLGLNKINERYKQKRLILNPEFPEVDNHG